MFLFSLYVSQSGCKLSELKFQTFYRVFKIIAVNFKSRIEAQNYIAVPGHCLLDNAAALAVYGFCQKAYFISDKLFQAVQIFRLQLQLSV